jgi:toxin YoeB
MEIDLYEKAIRDFEYWKKSGNKAIQKKISQIFNDMKAHPFEGIGKPEPLKYKLTGKWSRRINKKAGCKAGLFCLTPLLLSSRIYFGNPQDNLPTA